MVKSLVKIEIFSRFRESRPLPHQPFNLDIELAYGASGSDWWKMRVEPEDLWKNPCRSLASGLGPNQGKERKVALFCWFWTKLGKIIVEYLRNLIFLIFAKPPWNNENFRWTCVSQNRLNKLQFLVNFNLNLWKSLQI